MRKICKKIGKMIFKNAVENWFEKSVKNDRCEYWMYIGNIKVKNAKKTVTN